MACHALSCVDFLLCGAALVDVAVLISYTEFCLHRVEGVASNHLFEGLLTTPLSPFLSPCFLFFFSSFFFVPLSLSISLSIYIYIYLSINQSIYLSIYLFLFLFLFSLSVSLAHWRGGPPHSTPQVTSNPSLTSCLCTPLSSSLDGQGSGWFGSRGQL